MTLNILYQIKEKWNPTLDLGKARFLITFSFSIFYFTLMQPKLLKKKMKLAHQGLNYILYDRHQYYWQPSQEYSLDKSSYCLRHDVLDYDRASVTLWFMATLLLRGSGISVHNDFEFLLGETSESFCSTSEVHLQYLRTELLYRLKHVKTQRGIK